MTEKRTQEILRDYREAQDVPDLDLLDGSFAQDVVVHDASAPGDIQGLEARKAGCEGDLRGLPSAGRCVRFSGAALGRGAVGWIVEEWVCFELFDLLLPPDVAPAPGGAG